MNGSPESLRQTIESLKASPLVRQIYVIAAEGESKPVLPSGVNLLQSGRFTSSEAVKAIASHSKSKYSLLYTKSLALLMGPWGIERLAQVAADTGAAMVYADYYASTNDIVSPNPVIDYQEGSLRDDFNFGSVLLYRTDAMVATARKMHTDYQYSALYHLRLAASRLGPLVRIPEYLYTEIEEDTRQSGEKQFDYVDPRNRAVQIEMEAACTLHLKAVGAWLKPEFTELDLFKTPFSVEASVVIPVRNRAKTIEDAVRSVFSQKASFAFNLLVVDNHSTDGTTQILQRLATEDNRLILITPERTDLGIGGCWTTAVMDERCGRFAVQLDSDDLYIDSSTVQRIVDCFKAESCAMVVGSYQMVNFDLEEIPPGLIDHREWTPDNGRNNALRINGLGAPRAFYTPLLRDIRIPNTSYGEDYAVGLRISRHYRIGRIYEPLYLCRRWDDNSDASLDVVKVNGHNLYKDRLRTIELMARIAVNRSMA